MGPEVGLRDEDTSQKEVKRVGTIRGRQHLVLVSETHFHQVLLSGQDSCPCSAWPPAQLLPDLIQWVQNQWCRVGASARRLCWSPLLGLPVITFPPLKNITLGLPTSEGTRGLCRWLTSHWGPVTSCAGWATSGLGTSATCHYHAEGLCVIGALPGNELWIRAHHSSQSAIEVSTPLLVLPGPPPDALWPHVGLFHQSSGSHLIQPQKCLRSSWPQISHGNDDASFDVKLLVQAAVLVFEDSARSGGLMKMKQMIRAVV